MELFAVTVLKKLYRIMMKLSEQSSEELIMEALKISNRKILIHTKLIKKLTSRAEELTSRVEELEEMMTEKDDEVSLIHRILDSI